jgi:uncharacterized damage-inducible protein DinB
MSLRQLALHIASIPGNLTELTQLDEFVAAQANFTPPEPKGLGETHTAPEQSVRSGEEIPDLHDGESRVGELASDDTWQRLFSRPRIAALRSIMLNHWYHHRGQLFVYLRLLDVPVPVIYGRSADKNLFG